jgi:hypothetical protein
MQLVNTWVSHDMVLLHHRRVAERGCFLKTFEMLWSMFQPIDCL